MRFERDTGCCEGCLVVISGAMHSILNTRGATKHPESMRKRYADLIAERERMRKRYADAAAVYNAAVAATDAANEASSEAHHAAYPFGLGEGYGSFDVDD